MPANDTDVKVCRIASLTLVNAMIFHQVIATRPADAGEPDAVQVYEVTERRADAAGDPATFPGPVVALWPSGRRGEVVAIARSSETGRYAAYNLAISCNR